MLPLVQWQLDVIQLVPLWGILWTFTACLQLSRHPTWSSGVHVGLAFSVACLICTHQGLLFAVLLMGSVWSLPSSRPRWLRWWAGGIAVLVAAVVIGPLLVHIQRVTSRQEFARDPALVEQLSVHLDDYLLTTGHPLIEFGSAAPSTFWRLGPGWIKVSLALIAILFGLTRPRWRNWTACLCLIAGGACLWSLGPHLKIGNWQPWWTLTQIFPGFSRVRNVFRFAFFVQLALVLLAFQGVYLLEVMNRRFSKRQWCRTGCRWALVCLGLVAAFESRPAPVLLATAPQITSQQGWIDFVRDTTPPGKAIACFPFPAGQSVDSFEETARWMYYGTFHRVPLVNGYSGFFPREYVEFEDTMNAEFPSVRTLLQLAERGVEYVVTTRDFAISKDLDQAQFHEVEMQRVWQDSTGINIYRVRHLDRQLE